MDILDKTTLETYEKICKEADALLEDDSYNEAISCFQRALDILPDGLWSCEAYAYAGKGEAYQSLENWEEAFQSFMWAYASGQTENPYILMNIGICHYHLHNLVKAREFLLAAYKIGGEDVFEGAEEYLDIIDPQLSE